jgi:hypothetical protein
MARLAAELARDRAAAVQELTVSVILRTFTPSNDAMKIQITLLLTLTVASLSALAADITGTWKAEFETQRGLQKRVLGS